MSQPSIDVLLQHSRWVRTLAESLTRDPGLAEDIVQETWVSALRRGPEDDRSPRGWLATLLRRHLRQVRRGEERRALREERHARELSQPSASELVERAESQRDLAQAVLELREPFRSTVLLRFFEDLAPDQIAARMQVPLATVHSRLGRGLAALRERLERRGRVRPTWLGALAWLRVGRPVPCARELAHAAVPAGALAAGVALLVLVARVLAASGDTQDARTSSRGVALRGADSISGVEAAAASVDLRAPDEAQAASARRPLADPIAARPLRRARVLGRDGEPVAGVEVALVASESETAAALQRATSGPDGTFAFRAPESPAFLFAQDPHHATVLLALVDPEREAELALVVAPKVTFSGSVRTPEGTPIADAFLELLVQPGMPVAFQRTLDHNRPPRPIVHSDPDGGFRFEGVPSLPEGKVYVSRPGFRNATLALPERDRIGLEVVLARPEAVVRTVRGRVLDARGEPLAGAEVASFPAWTRCDAEGQFELSLWPTPVAPELVAVLPGAGAARLVLELDPDGSARWPAQITLRLPERLGEARGRVRDAGRPARNALVWLADPTVVRKSERGPLTAEALALAGDASAWHPVACDDSGAFRLPGLFERPYELLACDPRTLAVARATVRPGEHAELTLSTTLETIAGRVLDLRGAPLAGVVVQVFRETFRAEQGGEIRLRDLALPARITGADGRFTFPPCSPEGTRLRLSGDSILPTEFALERFERRDALELPLSQRTHLRVVPGGAGVQADAFEARDALGRARTLTVLRDGCSHPLERAQLAQGRSLVLAVPEDMRELVFFRGAEEVGRLPLVLEPGRLNLVHW
jgi:RNA polymerase sigma-70 factor (ECF subfamily)